MKNKKTIVFDALLAISLGLFVFTVQAELRLVGQIDQYEKIVLDAFDYEDCSNAIVNMDKLESGAVDLPPSFQYFKGVCYYKRGQYVQSMQLLGSYLFAAGNDDKYYKKALNIYTQAEEKKRSFQTQQMKRTAIVATYKKQLQQVKAQTGLDFVLVAPGCFIMGSPATETGRVDGERQHKACLSQGYLLGKYEITQAQWQQVMGSNPSHFGPSDLGPSDVGPSHLGPSDVGFPFYLSPSHSGSLYLGSLHLDPSQTGPCGFRCPVESVSWEDVQQFIEKLNAATGQQFRLPTEMEWEYACRSGGKSQKFCGSEYFVDGVGWYSANSGSKTHPVGQNQPNGLGLYDMSGNVSEWVQDWRYNAYSHNGPRIELTERFDSIFRGVRGGSWFSLPSNCRSAKRSWFRESEPLSHVGFRLAKTLSTKNNYDKSKRKQDSILY